MQYTLRVSVNKHGTEKEDAAAKRLRTQKTSRQLRNGNKFPARLLNSMLAFFLPPKKIRVSKILHGTFSGGASTLPVHKSDAINVFTAL